MQRALRSKGTDEEQIEETAHAYFSPCPFCGKEYSMSHEESLGQRYMFCKNCGRKWSITHALGTIWFSRTNDPNKRKSSLARGYYCAMTGRLKESAHTYCSKQTTLKSENRKFWSKA